jgi:uncharacterized membrane protein
LRQFENILPGSAQQIVEEFRQEAAHRRRQEAREGSLRITEIILGRLTALIFALVAFAVIAYAIAKNEPWVASIMSASLITAGIIAFINGRRSAD